MQTSNVSLWQIRASVFTDLQKKVSRRCRKAYHGYLKSNDQEECRRTDPLPNTPDMTQAPVSVDPYAMLLPEPVREVTLAPRPAYIDNMAMFDDKMFSLGMIRSRTQLNTQANGNCGPEGIYLNQKIST